MFLIFLSCNDPYCDELKFKLDNIICANAEECSIDMKEIFGNTWQYIYIFSSFNMTEDISETIGFDCECETIYDHTRLILLISNSKIIEKYKTECYSINLDRIIKNGFVKIDSSNSKLLLSIRGQGENKKYIFTFKK